MKIACSSTVLVPMYQTIQYHYTEEENQNFHHVENPQSNGAVDLAYRCFNIIQTKSCKWLQTADTKFHFRFSLKQNFQSNMKPAQHVKIPVCFILPEKKCMLNVNSEHYTACNTDFETIKAMG
jgi:hypothetical protein